jgi:hypothetical protein
MVVRVLLAVVLAGLGCLASCSGKSYADGAGGASNSDDPSPVEGCRTYASTWCNKAFGCYVKVGRLAQDDLQYNVDQCKQLIEDKLPCSEITSLGSDYDTCLTQINGMACSKWDVPQTNFGSVRPPATCDNALQFD